MTVDVVSCATPACSGLVSKTSPKAPWCGVCSGKRADYAKSAFILVGVKKGAEIAVTRPDGGAKRKRAPEDGVLYRRHDRTDFLTIDQIATALGQIGVRVRRESP